MRDSDVRKGMLVRTHKELDEPVGFSVVQRHLDARSADEVGIVKTQIPGHGGDVWWVEHRKDGGETTVAAYCFTEFEEY